MALVTQYQRTNNGFIEEIGSDILYSLLNSGDGGPFIYPEPAMVYPNPMTYGSAPWTEKRYIESDLTPPDLPLVIPGSLTDSSTVEIDAWGTLTLNDTPYPCLRLKYYEYRIIHIDRYLIIPEYDTTFASITYSWVNEDFEVLLELSSDANSGDNFFLAVDLKSRTFLSYRPGNTGIFTTVKNYHLLLSRKLPREVHPMPIILLNPFNMMIFQMNGPIPIRNWEPISFIRMISANFCMAIMPVCHISTPR